MRERPDQLDQWVALAINRIRRNTNEARKRLGIEPVQYQKVTAETVHWIDLQRDRGDD